MTLWSLGAAVALLAANAFFVWAEFALIAARRTRIEELVASGNRLARVTLGAMRDLNFVLAGAQLGITMASLGLGFVAEPAVGRLLEGPLEALPEAIRHGTEVALALGIVVSAHMVLGEMVPKNLAISDPERSALVLAPAFRVYIGVFRPVIWFLNVVANGLLRLLGVEPRSELVAAHSADEIAGMIRASRDEGLIESFQHGLLARTLAFDQLDARSVMVPRPDVVAVPVTATPADVGALAVETGHSRFPVYRDSLDGVVGFVHVKDVLALPPEAAARPVDEELIRPMLVTPESRLLPDLLTDMRDQRRHFAVVVDEHGGVDGLVSLEDVLEELVGEIRDEYDRVEGSIWRLGPRRVLVDAGLRPDEAERALGLTIPAGEYDTLAGFVMAELGRVPEVAEEVRYQGWVLVVRRMEGRRIDILEVVAPEPAESPPEGSGGAATF